jgi:hypothetical protein
MELITITGFWWSQFARLVGLVNELSLPSVNSRALIRKSGLAGRKSVGFCPGSHVQCLIYLSGWMLLLHGPRSTSPQPTLKEPPKATPRPRGATAVTAVLIAHRSASAWWQRGKVCFLALTMWRTLQQWMKASGLGTAPRKLLEELRELKSLDVLLPAREKNLRLRMVATPDNELKVLLQRMKIRLPNKPKIIENVVT